MPNQKSGSTKKDRSNDKIKKGTRRDESPAQGRRMSGNQGGSASGNA